MPNFDLENAITGDVCGVDEAGRGPLAGPVVAACVFIPENIRTLDFIREIKDSKMLSENKLQNLFAHIAQHCIVGIAQIDVQDIDRINILQASLKAMREAINNTQYNFNHALIDGNKIPADLPCPAIAIIKGDSKSTSIAAASIIAKFTRDQIMRDLHVKHHHYGWDNNVGYPTKAHRDAIDQHGITPHHRKSFAPVKNFLVFGSTRKPTQGAA